MLLDGGVREWMHKTQTHIQAGFGKLAAHKYPGQCSQAKSSDATCLRMSKNILFCGLLPYRPFPLQSNLPKQEKASHSCHGQIGDCIQTHNNSSLLRTSHKHFDNTHKQLSWVTRGHSGEALSWFNNCCAAEWEIHRETWKAVGYTIWVCN